MMVFNVSLHRTATQSTHAFAGQAGLSAIHYPEFLGDYDVQKVIRGREHDPQTVLGALEPYFHFEHYSDFPYAGLYEELFSAWPDALYYAIYRSPFAWVRSVRKHIAERDFQPFEKCVYWQYLSGRPESIRDVSDEDLLAMHLKFHSNLLGFFAGQQNFRLFELGDSELGHQLSAFLGIEEREFPFVDYTKDPQS